MNNIRNFTIIAHVDHGKSTLADQFIKLSKQTSEHDLRDQMLDDMSLEQERGITIKARTVRINIKNHILNLVDTPGHVDFSYEVSRSLLCCETSILLVDATKGVEAQTISNLYKAIDADHYIIPVINKIDSPNAKIEDTLLQMDQLGFKENEILYVSAKTGKGIDELLNHIIEHAPCPNGNSEKPLQALVIDSWYDKYIGVIALLCVKNGTLSKGNYIIGSSQTPILSLDVGYFTPKVKSNKQLYCGEIGYMATQLKDPSKLQVGETIIAHKDIDVLPGFKKIKPMVFCTLYPEQSDLVKKIKDSMEKYAINDVGFTFELKNSDVYGTAFHCGFLGVLHMEIVLERLFREYDVTLIPTIPSVSYKIITQHGNEEFITSPKQLESHRESFEPEAKCTIVTTEEYIGKVTNLCIGKRATNLNVSIEKQIIIECNMPLMEIITDFYDKLQSQTNGYSSFDYELLGYRQSNLGKLIILVNDDEIQELTTIVHQDHSKTVANKIVTKLKEMIPRAQFKIKIQAALGNKKNIIARADISPYRKDVIAHCYGGDVTRKKKLLEKQKKGKKRMIQYGKVSIPSDTITKLLQ